MKRVEVHSSNLKSIGYDTSNSTLEIEFHSGGVYSYSDVPESEYLELISAPSIGRYYVSNIKNAYKSRKND